MSKSVLVLPWLWLMLVGGCSRGAIEPPHNRTQPNTTLVRDVRVTLNGEPPRRIISQAPHEVHLHLTHHRKVQWDVLRCALLREPDDADSDSCVWGLCLRRNYSPQNSKGEWQDVDVSKTTSFSCSPGNYELVIAFRRGPQSVAEALQDDECPRSRDIAVYSTLVTVE